VRIIRKVVLYSLFLLLCVPVSCQRTEVQTEKRTGDQGTRLKILTTIPPLYSFTASIAGEHADVENLLPSGAGPHEYSFSPHDMKKIAEADILIKNGVNLEGWLDNAIASSGREDLIIVDTSTGIEIVENDPHIWLSPNRAIVQIKNIRDALMKADPERSAFFSGNADTYILRIQYLDARAVNEISALKKKEFVAFHSAFLYFCRDYGLKQVAVIQKSPEQEPSPGHMRNVIDIIKAKGITTIFTEPQASHKIVNTIAQDLNLRVSALDTLEIGELSPGWYEKKMRENLDAFNEALE
jgi:zinc/manganese transport system substrate-binding protein